MQYITFENPEFLWLLIALPMLVITHFAFLRNARVKGMKFANFSTIKRVTGKSLITKNYTQMFLRLGVVLFMVLAVSGTTIWYKGLVNESDFVIALDVSSSMTSRDVEPSRFVAAKNAAVTFVDKVNGDTKIGLITFSGETFISQKLTGNKILIKSAINRANVTKAGGTDLATALITSTNLLYNSNKSKSIILITDGSNTQGEFLQRSLDYAIDYLEEEHVIVYSLSIGTGEGNLGYLPEYHNISAIFETEDLEKVSNSTGGKVYSANTEEELNQAFSEINNLEEGIIKRELGFILLISSIILLFLEWGLIQTRFRRIA